MLDYAENSPVTKLIELIVTGASQPVINVFANVLNTLGTGVSNGLSLAGQQYNQAVAQGRRAMLTVLADKMLQYDIAPTEMVVSILGLQQSGRTLTNFTAAEISQVWAERYLNANPDAIGIRTPASRTLESNRIVRITDRTGAHVLYQIDVAAREPIADVASVANVFRDYSTTYRRLTDVGPNYDRLGLNGTVVYSRERVMPNGSIQLDVLSSREYSTGLGTKSALLNPERGFKEALESNPVWLNRVTIPPQSSSRDYDRAIENYIFYSQQDDDSFPTTSTGIQRIINEISAASAGTGGPTPPEDPKEPKFKEKLVTFIQKYSTPLALIATSSIASTIAFIFGRSTNQINQDRRADEEDDRAIRNIIATYTAAVPVMPSLDTLSGNSTMQQIRDAYQKYDAFLDGYINNNKNLYKNVLQFFASKGVLKLDANGGYVIENKYKGTGVGSDVSGFLGALRSNIDNGITQKRIVSQYLIDYSQRQTQIDIANQSKAIQQNSLNAALQSIEVNKRNVLQSSFNKKTDAEEKLSAFDVQIADKVIDLRSRENQILVDKSQYNLNQSNYVVRELAQISTQQAAFLNAWRQVTGITGPNYLPYDPATGLVAAINSNIGLAFRYYQEVNGRRDLQFDDAERARAKTQYDAIMAQDRLYFSKNAMSAVLFRNYTTSAEGQSLANSIKSKEATLKQSIVEFEKYAARRTSLIKILNESYDAYERAARDAGINPGPRPLVTPFDPKFIKGEYKTNENSFFGEEIYIAYNGSDLSQFFGNSNARKAFDVQLDQIFDPNGDYALSVFGDDQSLRLEAIRTLLNDSVATSAFSSDRIVEFLLAAFDRHNVNWSLRGAIFEQDYENFNLIEGLVKLSVSRLNGLDIVNTVTIANFIRTSLVDAGVSLSRYKSLAERIISESNLTAAERTQVTNALEAMGYFGAGSILAPREEAGTPAQYLLVRSQLRELLEPGTYASLNELVTRLNTYASTALVGAAALTQQLAVVYKSLGVSSATAEFLSTRVTFVRDGAVETLRGDVAALTRDYNDGQIARFVRSFLNGLGFNAAGRLDVLNRVFSDDTLVDATRKAAIINAVQAADTLDGRDQVNDWDAARTLLNAVAAQLRYFPNMTELLRAIDIASQGVNMLEGLSGVINRQAGGGDKLRSALAYFANQPDSLGEIAKGAQAISTIYDAVQKSYNVLFAGEGNITTGFNDVLQRLRTSNVIDAATADVLIRVNQAAGGVAGMVSAFKRPNQELVAYNEFKNLVRSIFSGTTQLSEVNDYLSGIEYTYKAIQSGYNAINSAEAGAWERFFAAGIGLLTNPTLFDAENIKGFNTVAASYRAIQNTINAFSGEYGAASAAVTAIISDTNLANLIGTDGRNLLLQARALYNLAQTTVNWRGQEPGAGDRALKSIDELAALGVFGKDFVAPLASVAYGYRAVQSAINAVNILTSPGFGAYTTTTNGALVAPANNQGYARLSNASNELANVNAAVKSLAALRLFDDGTNKVLSDVANGAEGLRQVLSFIDKPSLAGGVSLGALLFSSGLVQDPKLSYALNVANVALASNPIGWVLLGVDFISRIFNSGWRQDYSVYRSNIDLDKDYVADDTVMLNRSVHTDFWGSVTYHNGGFNYKLNTPAPSIIKTATLSVVDETLTVGGPYYEEGSTAPYYSLTTPDGRVYYGTIPYAADDGDGGSIEPTKVFTVWDSVDNSPGIPAGTQFALNGTPQTVLFQGRYRYVFTGMTTSRTVLKGSVTYDPVNPVTTAVTLGGPPDPRTTYGLGDGKITKTLTQAEATAFRTAMGGSSLTLSGADPRMSGTGLIAQFFNALTPEFNSNSVPYVYYYSDVNGDGIADLVREYAPIPGIGNTFEKQLRNKGFLGSAPTAAAVRHSQLQVTLLDKNGKPVADSITGNTDAEIQEKLRLSSMLMGWGVSHMELWGRALQGYNHALNQQFVAEMQLQGMTGSLVTYRPDIDLFYRLASESGALKLMRKAADLYGELSRTGVAAPTNARQAEIYTEIGKINFALGMTFDPAAYAKHASASTSTRTSVLTALLGADVLAAMDKYINTPSSLTQAERSLLSARAGATVLAATGTLSVAQRKSLVEEAVFSRIDTVDAAQHYINVGNAAGLKVDAKGLVQAIWNPQTQINASPSTAITSGWGSVSYVYDTLDRLVETSSVQLDGSRTVTRFDGAGDKWWTWIQDNLDTSGKRVSQSGLSDTGETWAATFRTGVNSAPSTSTTKTMVDGSDDVLKLIVISPDKTQRSEEFDTAGRLDKRISIDANGVTTTTLFNDLVMPTQVTIQNPTTGSKIVRLYNSANKLASEVTTIMRSGTEQTLRTFVLNADNTTTTTEYDILNEKSWSRDVVHLAADGVTLLSSARTDDDGSISYEFGTVGSVTGTAGDDTLYGNPATTTTWDTLSGGAGNDTYVYSMDAGLVYIGSASEGTTTGTADKVVFADLTLADISVSYYDYGATSPEGKSIRFIWSKNGKTGELRIANEAKAIESFQFADGTTLRSIAVDTANRLVLTGTAGNDRIVGDTAIDLIFGGAGNDTLEAGGNSTAGWEYLYGQAGDDTYVYRQGDGLVYIGSSAESATTGTADKLVFADLNLTDISVSYFDYGATSAEGKAIRLTWSKNGKSGEVRIANEGNSIESYEFADGTVIKDITVDASNRLVLTGSSAADRITSGSRDGRHTLLMGGSGDDTLDNGGIGATGLITYLFGQDGNDSYIYRQAEGITMIHPGSESATTGNADKVVFADLNLADLTISYVNPTATAGTRVLRLAWSRGGKTGELQIANEGTFIESFEFADGTVVRSMVIDASNRLILNGTNGNDIIVGDTGVDIIYGGAGSDTLEAGGNSTAGWEYLYGQAGDDTYVYRQGDGSVYIGSTAESTTTGIADKVVFADLNLSDITVSYHDYGATSPEGKAIRFNWSKNGKTGELRISQEAKFIERFEFADGTVLTDISVDAFGRLTLTGTSGNDTITGGNGSNVIYGGAGNDRLEVGGNTTSTGSTLFGEAGDDTYVYRQGDGSVFISSTSESATTGTADKVVFADLNLADVTVYYYDYGATSSEGKGLSFLWSKDGKTGELRIANEGKAIESYEFADGTVLRSITIDAYNRFVLTGTAGDDTITGGNGASLIYGGAGNDRLEAGANTSGWSYLYGQAGDDTYVYRQGDGLVYIGSTAESATTGTADRVVFSDLNLADITLSYRDYGTTSAEGKALRFNWSKNGKSGELQISQEAKFIESFQFADGTILTSLRFSTVDGILLTGITPDGLRLQGDYDVANARSSYRFLTNAIDSAGKIKRQAGVTDAGNEWLTSWQNGMGQAGPSQRIDWDNVGAQAWWRQTADYDAQSRLARFETVFDNGTKSVDTYNFDTTQTWTKLTQVYSATGTLISQTQT